MRVAVKQSVSCAVLLNAKEALTNLPDLAAGGKALLIFQCLRHAEAVPFQNPG
jgi:hypothetical protein